MKNFWRISLTTSISIHAIILFGVPTLPLLKNDTQKPQRSINIVRQIKRPPIPQPVQQSPLVPPPPKYVDHLESMPLAAKEVLLSDQPINNELKRLPAYASYYQLIRNKIRKHAFKYYDSIASGEVFLTFVITKDGVLDTLIVKNNATGTIALEDIAIRSIKESAPFPQFPDELKSYTKLQFTISIAFKNS